MPNFTPAAVERLDLIKEKMQARTYAEVVRQSLRVFEWLLTQVQDEDQVQIVRGEDVVESFKAKFLKSQIAE